MEDVVPTAVSANLSVFPIKEVNTTDNRSSIEFMPTEVPTGNDDIGNDVASRSIRDGPAEDEKKVFDTSAIPMLTTSPSKHGSNLNAYIDVCHSWIETELQSKNLSKAQTTSLDELAVSPMQRYEADDNDDDDGDLSDEEGDAPVSLNCSSDSSTGPPPPPPPLVPSVEPEMTLVTSSSNTACISESERVGSATMVADGTPFDEVTVATQELDTTIDTALVVQSEVTEEGMDNAVDLTEAKGNEDIIEDKGNEDIATFVPAPTQTIAESAEEKHEECNNDNIVVSEEIDYVTHSDEATYEVETADGNCIVDGTSGFHEQPPDIKSMELISECFPENVATPLLKEIVDVVHGITDVSEQPPDIEALEPISKFVEDAVTVQGIEENIEIVEEHEDEIEEGVVAKNFELVALKVKNGLQQDPLPFDEVMEAHQDNMDTTIDEIDTRQSIADKNDTTINEISDEMKVETIHDAVFIGDLESPHDIETVTASEVPFVGTIMSPSADKEFKYPLDEEILSMSPTELNAFVQYIKSTYDATQETTSTDVNGTYEVPNVKEGMMLGLESSALTPEDVLSAVGEFAMPVASNILSEIHLEGDTKESLPISNEIDEPLDKNGIVNGETSRVIVEPELDLVTLQAEVVPHETTKLSSTASFAQEDNDVISNSRYTVIHQELEDIEQMIVNPPKLDMVNNSGAAEGFGAIGTVDNKKKPITESDILFEHLWKETTSELNAPVAPEKCETMNTEMVASSPIARGSKNHVVSGNMDFLSTRKGSAYVDYAKRSAHKFQKAKEEILKGDELDKAATLSLSNGDKTLGDNNPTVTVDLNEDPDIAPTAISPVSENEIRRVPTTEEKKSTPPKPESVTTSCMDTCVVM